MLRAQVEIIRHADRMPLPIGTLEAENVGGDEYYGDYEIRLYQHCGDCGSGPVTVRHARLVGFRRARGALMLVKEALSLF